MKKTLSLLLVLCLVVGLLAGCGEPANTSKPQSQGTSGELTADITLWTYPIGKWGDSATVTEMIANFNKVYPKVNVKVEYLDYQNGDDQVNTAIEGGAAPDLVMEGPERLVANWGSKGLMVPLNDLWTDEQKADINASVEAACKDASGNYYEYPLCMTAHCMAINKTVFEKANAMQYVDAENHTWTTENFLKAVAAVKASGQETVGAVYCGGQGGDQGTRALINNLYGGTFTDAAHTKYTADSAENIKALEKLKGTDGIVFDPSIVGSDEINMFRNGTFAMAFCWNIAQQTNADNSAAGTTNNGDEILFMSFPSETGESKLCGGIWGFGIFDNKDENRIKASKAFIDFMCNDKTQVVESVKASGYFSVKNSQSGIWADDPVMNEYGKLMPYLGDYYQVVSGWSEARVAWWNMLQQVGSGTDVTAAVNEFCATANAAAGAK